MTNRPRKLLTLAAPFFAAALGACGTTAAPAARTTAIPAPVTAPAATPVVAAVAPTPMVLAVSETAPAPAPAPAPVAATPLCDSSGRPLSGNVRTKKASMECTPAQLAAAAVTPGSE